MLTDTAQKSIYNHKRVTKGSRGYAKSIDYEVDYA